MVCRSAFAMLLACLPEELPAMLGGFSSVTDLTEAQEKSFGGWTESDA